MGRQLPLAEPRLLHVPQRRSRCGPRAGVAGAAAAHDAGIAGAAGRGRGAAAAAAAWAAGAAGHHDGPTGTCAPAAGASRDPAYGYLPMGNVRRSVQLQQEQRQGSTAMTRKGAVSFLADKPSVSRYYVTTAPSLTCSGAAGCAARSSAAACGCGASCGTISTNIDIPFLLKRSGAAGL